MANCDLAMTLASVLLVTLIAASIPADAKTEPPLGITLEVKDANGPTYEYALTIGEPIITTTTVIRLNDQYPDDSFTLIAEIRDKRGVTQYLQAIELELNGKDRSTTDFDWVPADTGQYYFAAMAISNLTSADLLRWYGNLEFIVLEPCNLPKCRVLGDDNREN